MKMARPLMAALAALALGASTSANSQGGDAWPARPIRILVGFAAGGGTDVATRIVAPKLAERLGQPVVVENKPGMGGGLAVDAAAKASPDGYTLVVANSGSITALPSLYKNLPYNPERDLAPITSFGVSPLVLIAGPTFQGKNLGDLIALAKAQPGKISYATAGSSGTAPHLAAELFKKLSGTNMVNIPYKGGAPALVAVMAGEVPIGFVDLATVRSQVDAGKVRALAVLSKSRTSVAPDIPTVQEQGVKGYEADGWFAMLAPAGTPPAVIARLNKEVTGILASTEMRARFATTALETTYSSPAEVSRMIHRDIEKWATLIREQNITIE